MVRQFLAAVRSACIGNPCIFGALGQASYQNAVLSQGLLLSRSRMHGQCTARVVGAFMCLWKGRIALELRGRVLHGANNICDMHACSIDNAAEVAGPLVSTATRMFAKLELKLCSVNESPTHSLASGQPGQRSCISHGFR